MTNPKYFIEENLVSETEHISPSGIYTLVIGKYKTQEGCWAYSQGSVYKIANNHPIAIIQRNYDAFPFAWVEDHPNGNDYLIASENYQGQGIVELSTGITKQYLPESAKKGLGFCWSSIYPSPNKLYLAVGGCYWGAPYEPVIYDFSNPLDLPWNSLYQSDGDEVLDFHHWNEDNTCSIGKTYNIYNDGPFKGRSEYHLSDAEDIENDAWVKSIKGSYDYDSFLTEVKDETFVWSPKK